MYLSPWVEGIYSNIPVILGRGTGTLDSLYSMVTGTLEWYYYECWFHLNLIENRGILMVMSLIGPNTI